MFVFIILGVAVSTFIKFHIRKDLQIKLDELAQTLCQPRSYIIKKVIEEYLEEYTDYLIAVERLNDKDDKIISGKQLRDKLGL